MWASCEERAKEQQKEEGHARGARIVKAASHKHPHNDLYDERPFGDSFLVLRPIFLSLRSRCARAYTFSALFLSPSFSLLTLCSTVSPFLSPFAPRSICPCTSSRRHLSSSSPSPRSSLSLPRASSSLVFLLARQGIPRGVFFQRGSTREHAAPSWGACINIRLIMPDATITGPRGPQVRPGAFLARATVKFLCPNTMFNLHIAVAYVA